MGENGNRNGMHRRVDWMVAADPEILRYLANARDAYGNPAEETPKTMGRNTGYSRKHCGNRARVLVEHDLVEKTDRGVYRITERGEKAVEGEIPPEEL